MPHVLRFSRAANPSAMRSRGHISEYTTGLAFPEAKRLRDACQKTLQIGYKRTYSRRAFQTEGICSGSLTDTTAVSELPQTRVEMSVLVYAPQCIPTMETFLRSTRLRGSYVESVPASCAVYKSDPPSRFRRQRSQRRARDPSKICTSSNLDALFNTGYCTMVYTLIMETYRESSRPDRI